MAAKIQRDRDNGKVWRERNKEYKALKDKEYYDNNKERINEQNRNYHHLHKEEIKVQKKVYSDSRKDEKREYDIKYREENRDHLLEVQRLYREKNREAIRERQRTKKAEASEYRKAHKDRYSDHSKRRRAKILSNPVEEFASLEIYMRDGWICQFCKKRVDKKLKWPHPMSASLDHIIAVADGGPHTRANTQLAHLECNVRAKTGGVKQLRMFG
jgi:hypothetical protein